MRTAPINLGQNNTYRKVRSDLGYLAPLWCNLAHKRVAGNSPETSRNLPGRQPAAPQNLRMGCRALHQSIRGQKPPIGKCPQIWAILPHCGRETLPTSVLQGVSRKLQRNCPGGSRPPPKNPEWAISGCTNQPGEKNCPQESAWCMGQAKRPCVLSCPIVVQLGATSALQETSR